MRRGRVYALPIERRTGDGPGSHAAFRQAIWFGTTRFVTEGTRLMLTNQQSGHWYDLFLVNDSEFFGLY